MPANGERWEGAGNRDTIRVDSTPAYHSTTQPLADDPPRTRPGAGRELLLLRRSSNALDAAPRPDTTTATNATSITQRRSFNDLANASASAATSDGRPKPAHSSSWEDLHRRAAGSVAIVSNGPTQASINDRLAAQQQQPSHSTASLAPEGQSQHPSSSMALSRSAPALDAADAAMQGIGASRSATALDDRRAAVRRSGGEDDGRVTTSAALAAAAAERRRAEEELAIRAAAEARRREEEKALRAAGERAAAEEALKDAAERRRVEEDGARVAAERRRAEEEAGRLASERRRADEEAARVAVDRRRADEDAARVAGERRRVEEEAARLASERRKAEEEERERARKAAEEMEEVARRREVMLEEVTQRARVEAIRRAKEEATRTAAIARLDAERTEELRGSAPALESKTDFSMRRASISAYRSAGDISKAEGSEAPSFLIKDATLMRASKGSDSTSRQASSQTQTAAAQASKSDAAAALRSTKSTKPAAATPPPAKESVVQKSAAPAPPAPQPQRRRRAKSNTSNASSQSPTPQPKAMSPTAQAIHQLYSGSTQSPIPPTDDPTAKERRPAPLTLLHRLTDDNRRLRDLVTHLLLSQARLESDLTSARDERDELFQRASALTVDLQRALSDRDASDHELAAAVDGERDARKEVAEHRARARGFDAEVAGARAEVGEWKARCEGAERERAEWKKDRVRMEGEVSRLTDLLMEVEKGRERDRKAVPAQPHQPPVQQHYAAPQQAYPAPKTAPPAVTQLHQVTQCMREVLHERRGLEQRLHESSSRLREAEACLKMLQTWRVSMESERQSGRSRTRSNWEREKGEADEVAVEMMDKVSKIKKELRSLEVTLQVVNHNNRVGVSFSDA
ncbi:hypothetical protein HK101_003095 [Irineochytrium annulatum]|nr:hypothetical protein HK101_003095 [Irineochytrium annulatum]